MPGEANNKRPVRSGRVAVGNRTGMVSGGRAGWLRLTILLLSRLPLDGFFRRVRVMNAAIVQSYWPAQGELSK